MNSNYKTEGSLGARPSSASVRSRASRCLHLVVLAVALLASQRAGAIPITFDLRDTTATSEIESGVITRSGLTATLTPLVAGSSGLLNQTGSGFGINASGSGDATDQLDGVAGAESIRIEFDKEVSFTALKLSSMGTSDEGRLTIAGGTPISLTGNLHTFTSDNLVPVGDSVLLEWVKGNGFSFDSFTVEWVPRGGSAVSDAGSTLPLFALGFLVLAAFGAQQRARCISFWSSQS